MRRMTAEVDFKGLSRKSWRFLSKLGENNFTTRNVYEVSPNQIVRLIVISSRAPGDLSRKITKEC